VIKAEKALWTVFSKLSGGIGLIYEKITGEILEVLKEYPELELQDIKAALLYSAKVLERSFYSFYICYFSYLSLQKRGILSGMSKQQNPTLHNGLLGKKLP